MRKKVDTKKLNVKNIVNSTINENIEKNTNKTTKKNKLIITLQILLVLSFLVLIGMLLFDFYSFKVMNKDLSQVVDELDKKIAENKNEPLVVILNDLSSDNPDSINTSTSNSIKIGNLTVLGKIKIPKINIEYPILEYKNDEALWKSICKISSNSINGTGNLCLAGHNMRNMTMFAKIKRLNVGDTVEITNIYGDKYVYTIYESYYVDPLQVEVLKNTSEPIITLITCNNTSDKRLIVRGKLQ